MKYCFASLKRLGFSLILLSTACVYGESFRVAKLNKVQIPQDYTEPVPIRVDVMRCCGSNNFKFVHGYELFCKLVHVGFVLETDYVHLAVVALVLDEH